MTPHGPPFDFDLNEPPPPENDGVDGMSAVPVPEPSVQQDPLPLAPVPEPSAQQDPLPPPAPVPAEPTTAHVALPARSLALAPEASPDEPLPARSLAPAPDASPVDPLPAPLRAAPVPVPSPHHHLPSPSPVLDLEAPLSSLDDEDEDEADLPLPPPPPLPLPPPPPPPPSWYAPTAVVSSGRQGDAARQYSSPETWAPRGRSRAATASDTTSSQMSRRRRPYSCDDAISKQHGGRHAPVADGQPVALAPARNRRRRRRAQRPQHGGPVQRQQGFRGQEGRPQVHHGPHHGPEVPKVGYASYHPPSGSLVRRDASGGRVSPEQERVRATGWDRRPCRENDDAPPFRPPSSSSSRPPHGRDDGSYGGRHIVPPPEEKTITGGGGHHHQQTKAPPRGRDEHFSDRAYHPYARRVSGFDRPGGDDGGGRNPARREPRDSYEHRRYSKEFRSGGPSGHGLRYYGDVQE
ncbi:hypothetical protein SORBI_3009G153300 [Sorghum bicolor]|uniref:Uncharacterized protein n=1 Tax=Sorghum bicolor TaxID=4558 RepID=C5YYR0_SORBI|nr:hypothetical protein SORBI_3009G153300 [Sorghum bicolor]